MDNTQFQKVVDVVGAEFQKRVEPKVSDMNAGEFAAYKARLGF